ncbi:hypothetical protein Asp14428_61270 [Actinoplanes sp. NBRC 14428]|nr:hypothetical protein Asp14428_61270 [Actinoplanes sp. NBRC 14428]
MNAHTVLLTLLRMYRPIFLWFGATLVIGVGIADLVLGAVTEPAFSLWMFVAASAVKYWVLVIGVILVSTHLRQFVAAGVTRRALVTGGLIFGVLTSLAVAVLVPLGHGLEDALLGEVAAGYPAWSPRLGLGEFGHVLPSCLAFFVSGAAVVAAFYRYGAWRGLPLLVPALLPALVTEGLLGLGGNGELLTRFLPYAAAVTVSVGLSLVGAMLYRRVMRDVTIRRSTTS